MTLYACVLHGGPVLLGLQVLSGSLSNYRAKVVQEAYRALLDRTQGGEDPPPAPHMHVSSSRSQPYIESSLMEGGGVSFATVHALCGGTSGPLRISAIPDLYNPRSDFEVVEEKVRARQNGERAAPTHHRQRSRLLSISLYVTTDVRAGASR